MSDTRIKSSTDSASLQPQTEESPPPPRPEKDALSFFFYADGQDHHVSQVTSIQSRSLDYRKRLHLYFTPVPHFAMEPTLDVSLRPQALKMGGAIMERHVQSIRQERFSDHHEYVLGDDLDTSNLSELYLNFITYAASAFGADVLSKVFGIDAETVQNWTDEDWQSYVSTAEKKPLEQWVEELERAVMHYETEDADDTDFYPFASRAIGNHDGAAWGNGLDHGHPWISYVFWVEISKIEQRSLAQKISKLKDRLLEESQPGKVKKLKARISKLEQRKAVVDTKLPLLEDAKKKAEFSLKDKSLKDQSHTLSRFLTNQIFGITSTQHLDSPEGYWAANAGGKKYTVNKEDYIYHYLRTRYPEVGLRRVLPESSHRHPHHNHLELMPLATQIYFEDLDDEPKTDDYHTVNTVKNPDTGELEEMTSETLVLDDGLRSSIGKHYENFWKEIRPGEFICLVDYPNRDKSEPCHHYIFLQAFDQGLSEDGKRVFHFVLDGMDFTQEDADIAYFGAMSNLQRQLCQVFINYHSQTALTNGEKPLFLHSSHFSIEDHSRRFWQRYGWPEYFAQPHVAPFLFVGHGHMRKMTNEAKPGLFGSKRVATDGDFFSLMTPSSTDAPNEFMTVKIHHDRERAKYVLAGEYHPILSDDDIANSPGDTNAYIGYDIVQTVESLRQDYFRQHRYWEYTDQPLGLITSLKNMLFSQDRIVAFDSIPIAAEGQFPEALVYASYHLKFLRSEFGDYDADLCARLASENSPEARTRLNGLLYLKLAQTTFDRVQKDYQLWLDGDPEAEKKYDIREHGEPFIIAKKMGYLKAKKLADEMLLEKDKISLMLNFRDVFASPSYQRLTEIINATPKDTDAYKFWLYLTKCAAEEEFKATDKSFARHRALTATPDKSEYEFDD